MIISRFQDLNLHIVYSYHFEALDQPNNMSNISKNEYKDLMLEYKESIKKKNYCDEKKLEEEDRIN
jgi:hypothetical protein